MVTAKADFEEFENKEKFRFASIARRFKSSKKKIETVDKKPRPKRKFSLKSLFTRRKEPDVEFNSGYGECFANFKSQLASELLSIQQTKFALVSRTEK